MFRKTLVLSFVLVLSHSALAQEALQRRPMPDAIRPNTPCPHPYSQTLSGGPSGASSPVAAEFPANIQASIAGSVWSQTQADKHFAHTFRVSGNGECCIATSGTLRVTLKALAGGGVGSPTSVNDAVHVFSGGTVVQGLSQQPWLSSGVGTGATTTVTIQIPPNVLATGLVTFYVQDDASVTNATLTVSGCCLKKPKA
ncbi:MAG TPA: hypothetical protein VF883_03885 [Thermoanaerobaculia bacterium]